MLIYHYPFVNCSSQVPCMFCGSFFFFFFFFFFSSSFYFFLKNIFKCLYGFSAICKSLLKCSIIAFNLNLPQFTIYILLHVIRYLFVFWFVFFFFLSKMTYKWGRVQLKATAGQSQTAAVWQYLDLNLQPSARQHKDFITELLHIPTPLMCSELKTNSQIKWWLFTSCLYMPFYGVCGCIIL